MPRNEKKYQKELCDACRASGGYAIRLQRMFIKGVPDVGLKHLRFPMRFVEVKHLTYTKLPQEIHIETSALQRQQIREMRKAGIVAGWCCFVSVGKKTYYVCSMGQTYAKTVITPTKLMLWDKSEDALLTILQSL